MRRGPYAKVVERNAQLLERIRDLKAEHPFWGYRRIWAYLRYVDSLIVNQKRIYGVIGDEHPRIALRQLRAEEPRVAALPGRSRAP